MLVVNCNQIGVELQNEETTAAEFSTNRMVIEAV